MSFDGSGTYNRVPGSAYTNGTTNDGSELDAEMNDLATALSLCLPRDGQAAATGNLPMGGYKLTGAGAGSSNQDSIIYAQAVGYGMLPNLSLTATVGSSALTIAVKGRDGNDPSATNPITVPFRSATATAGTWTAVSITSALSVVVSSGSTLGHGSAEKAYSFVYLINNSGTAELAISSKFFGWNGIASTTAEGGAGAADTSTVMYSTTSRASVPYRCIAMLTDTQTTAGTWAAVPTAIDLAPFDLPEISFSANKNATNQTGIADAMPTKLTFTTEAYDVSGDYDATNSKLIAPMPGRYEFYAKTRAVNPTDGMAVEVMLYKNGSVVRTFSSRMSTTATASDDVGVSATLDLVTSDEIEVYVQHSRGTGEDFTGTATVTYFEGRRVGP